MSERRWYCMNCNADLGPAVGKHLQKCPECGSRNAYAKDADLVRCRDCREVRHELPARVGNYERAERWMCGWWTGCETLPDAFCSFGKRAAK